MILHFSNSRPTREFFTHMDTSPWPVKGCVFFSPVLGTPGHWAVRIFKRATPTVTRGTCLQWSSPRTSDTHAYCRAFGSGAFTTFFNDLGLSRLGFEHPTFRLKGEHSKPLRPVVVKDKNFQDTEEKKKPLRNKAQCTVHEFTFLAIWHLTILLRLRFAPLLSIRKHFKRIIRRL